MTVSPRSRSRLRTLIPSRASTDRYWLGVDDADTFVLIRTLYGLIAFLWIVTFIPDFDLVFLSDGFNEETTYNFTHIVSLFRYIDSDAAFIGAGIVMGISSAATMAGVAPRFSVPLTSFLFVSFIDESRPWGIGAEFTLLLVAVYLGIFCALTPTSHQGHFANASGSRGRAPVWGLRLLQIQIALAYLSTGVSKLNGADWRDGSASFHALEAAELQRFVPPAWLTDNVWTVRSMTYSTLLIELSLGPLLIWPRTRRFAVILAIGLHVGFEVFLELGFFAAAMTMLILGFLPSADAKRFLNSAPWNWRRSF